MNLQEIKKKYFIETESKIFVGNAEEIKSLILTVEDQAETIELYKVELQKAKDTIKQLEKESASLNQSNTENVAVKVPAYSDADDQY